MWLLGNPIILNPLEGSNRLLVQIRMRNAIVRTRQVVSGIVFFYCLFVLCGNFEMFNVIMFDMAWVWVLLDVSSILFLNMYPTIVFQ